MLDEDPLSAAVSAWSTAMKELLQDGSSDVHGVDDHGSMMDAAYVVAGMLKVAKAVLIEAGHANPSAEAVAATAIVLERRWNSIRREGEDWRVKRERSRLGRRIATLDAAEKSQAKYREQAAEKRKPKA
jgi:hypothetical protein